MISRGRAQGQPAEAAPERAGGSAGREPRGPEAPAGRGSPVLNATRRERGRLARLALAAPARPRQRRGARRGRSAHADAERRGLALAAERGVRVAVTPYYASLIDPAHPSCPVRMQAIPRRRGVRDASPATCAIPWARTSAAPRGPSSTATRTAPCSSRPTAAPSTAATAPAAGSPSRARARSHREDLDGAIAYLRAHPAIRDVIVSGGDPLVLDDDRLDGLLSALRAVPHVKVLRLATRAPVGPARCGSTGALAALLRRHAPLFVVTHFNHPKECTAEARAACETLVDPASRSRTRPCSCAA